MRELLPADVLVLRALATYVVILLVTVVALLWTRVAAGRVLDQEADDLARVKHDRPLTITGEPHA